MKIRYITIVTALAAGLQTGCINIKVGCDSKARQHEGKESEDREEEDEDHDSKARRHEGKQSEEREDEDSKVKRHDAKESGEEDEKEEGRDSKAKLLARAKVSESEARRTAQARVPNGTIKEGELEMEKGKLQWSFDIATPDSKDITEVNVDAITGKVISVDKETPKDQANEKEEDEKKEKKDKE